MTTLELIAKARATAEKALATNKTAIKAVEYAETASYYLACGNEDAALYWAQRAIKEAE